MLSLASALSAQWAPGARYDHAILSALQAPGRHVYGGTVSDATIATRRRRNKAARLSRRINRAR